jgi:hypothetical protein
LSSLLLLSSEDRFHLLQLSISLGSGGENEISLPFILLLLSPAVISTQSPPSGECKERRSNEIEREVEGNGGAFLVACKSGEKFNTTDLEATNL